MTHIKYLLFLFLLTLISCGFNALIIEDSFSFIGSVSNPSTSSLQDTEVGSIALNEGSCSQTSYKLKNDYNGLFKITDKGKVLLAKDNPPAGTYHLVILGYCDESYEEIHLDIIILASNNPWLKQIGSVTAVSLGGEASNYDECRSLQRDSAGNSYCTGITWSSLGEVNGGASDAFVVKFDPNGTVLWLRQFGSVTAASLGGEASGYEYCSSLQINSIGNSYCVGETYSSLGEVNGGDSDVFIIKLGPNGEVL